jgi:SAM-dependent methyltransferase
MRRRTMVALVVGGAAAAVTVGAFARRWIWYGGETSTPPDEDAMFTVFAPGGRGSFFVNGPIGRVMAKVMPIVERGVYEVVAEMLELQPDDELLDIGSGPGAFLATKAAHVRRAVGIDPSPVMLHEAEQRLADRIAAGTARLISGSAAALPFEDGEFSAATAIFAPAKPTEVFRVLRPGGRFVMADPDPKMGDNEPSTSWGAPRWGEADYRQMLENCGFVDLTVRFVGTALLMAGHKPPASIPNGLVQTDEREPVASAVSA